MTTTWHSHCLPCSGSGHSSGVHRQPLRCVSYQQLTSQLASSRQLPGSRRRPFGVHEKRRTGQPALAMQQPMLIPRTQDMAGDPFGLLLRQRIVFLGGEVNDFGADALVSQLLLLDSTDPTKDIKLFINSPGGSVTAGMGIYDAMMMCNADVQTYCFGLAASMGAFLLGAGTKGKRYSMPNARIMIHQPLGGASGQAVDIEIQAREIMYHKANINRIMADYTGQPIEKLEDDTDRDRYMSPLESKQYGLIDHIIGGDDAGFEIKGSPTDFPKTRPEYIRWGEELEEELAGRGSRFRGVPLEPHTKPLDNEKSAS